MVPPFFHILQQACWNSNWFLWKFYCCWDGFQLVPKYQTKVKLISNNSVWNIWIAKKWKPRCVFLNFWFPTGLNPKCSGGRHKSWVDTRHCQASDCYLVCFWFSIWVKKWVKYWPNQCPKLSKEGLYCLHYCLLSCNLVWPIKNKHKITNLISSSQCGQ